MKIYDISLTVSPSLPVWPGDPSIVLERISKMEDGEHNNVSRMASGVARRHACGCALPLHRGRQDHRAAAPGRADRPGAGGRDARRLQADRG